MKKVISLALALVLAFSCMTMVFAADEAAAVESVETSVNGILSEVDILGKLTSAIEDACAKIVAFFEGLVNGGSDLFGVEGAVSDLESALKNCKIDLSCGAIKDFLDSIKAKIKALYCGEPATTEVEATPETGSASTGIAAFAAISVAAAAAYVCTKKKVA